MKNLYVLIPLFVLFACAMPQPEAGLQSFNGDQGKDGQDQNEDSNLHNYQARYYQYAALTLQDDSGDSIDVELKFAERQGNSGCLIESATVCIHPGAKKEAAGAKSERIEYLDLEYYQWWRNSSQAILRYIGLPSTDDNRYPRLSFTCDDKASDKGVHSLTSVRYASNTSSREDIGDKFNDESVTVYKATVKGFSFIERWADGHCGEVYEDETEDPTTAKAETPAEPKETAQKAEPNE